MSDLTKKAIKASFLEMLDRMPLSEISVKKIADSCGINRNTFYYHYEDLPSLIEEIISEQLSLMFPEDASADSLENGIFSVLDYASKNRRSIFHIYNSVSRSIFEDYLWKYTDKIIREYLTPEFARRKLNDADSEMIISVLRCLLAGLTLDFVNSGMSEENAQYIHLMFTTFHGAIEDMMDRCGRISANYQ